MAEEGFNAQELAELPEGEAIGFERCDDKLVDTLKEQTSRYKKVTVMVAGKPRMGKSTALNNLFDLKLPADATADSVTTRIIDKTIKKNGVLVRYIDTPGLEALDVDSKTILEDMKKTLVCDGNFTLLYCHNVITTFTMEDVSILSNLHSIFGADIWKRCVLVLTRCDTARYDTFGTEAKDEGYKEFLSTYVEKFKEALKKGGLPALPVKLMFDCRDGKTMPDTIVAVPVAGSRDKGMRPSILPGFNMGEYLNWSDYVFVEILKKSGKVSLTLIQLRYQLMPVGKSKGEASGGAGAISGAAGAVAGAAGAVAGAVTGYFPLDFLISQLLQALKRYRRIMKGKRVI